MQQVVFKLGQDVPGKRNYFQINFEAFDPNHTRKVVLNTIDQWSLTTIGDPIANNGIPPLPHVFHIHVNPFQFVRQGPAGAETVWKDTVLVPPETQINVYTHYTDYIGQFVLHCHILDHEDLGMMEVVEVVEPEGSHPCARSACRARITTEIAHGAANFTRARNGEKQGPRQCVRCAGAGCVIDFTPCRPRTN